mmetsp:Transcript_41235/g.96699  ORF Transcript_41235/g.96699 Transcript_41235/m.96699 type:complete len:261 (+) Transcript_41235:115-897(+)
MLTLFMANFAELGKVGRGCRGMVCPASLDDGWDGCDGRVDGREDGRMDGREELMLLVKDPSTLRFMDMVRVEVPALLLLVLLVMECEEEAMRLRACSALSMAMMMLHPLTRHCASAWLRHWKVRVRLAGPGGPRAAWFGSPARIMVTATAFLNLAFCRLVSGTPRLLMGVSARLTTCEKRVPPCPCRSMLEIPLFLTNFLSQRSPWGQWLRSPAPLSSALVRRKVTSLLTTSHRGCHFFSVLSLRTSRPRILRMEVNFSR